MNATSQYRIVFWGLVLLFVMAFASAGVLVSVGWLGGIRDLAELVPLFILSSLYIGCIAAIVHHDASKRGMDPWLWPTIAAFVPYLVGVVIYLVARSNAVAPCSHCGRSLPRGARFCPHCGTSCR